MRTLGALLFNCVSFFLLAPHFALAKVMQGAIDIDRGNRILVAFRTPSDRHLSFSGSVIGVEGDKLKADVATNQADNPGEPVPVDLVTTSASGLDPDISPAAAEFQVPRVAKQRGITEDQARRLVQEHTLSRQLDFLGEPRVNVLDLNLDLNAKFPMK